MDYLFFCGSPISISKSFLAFLPVITVTSTSTWRERKFVPTPEQRANRPTHPINCPFRPSSSRPAACSWESSDYRALPVPPVLAG